MFSELDKHSNLSIYNVINLIGLKGQFVNYDVLCLYY